MAYFDVNCAVGKNKISYNVLPLGEVGIRNPETLT